MTRFDEMTAEIERREKELEELKKKQAARKAEPAEHQLARYLHDMMCNFNHTDGCSWHYEINNGVDDWSAYAHSSYLTKANRLLSVAKNPGLFDVQRIIKIVSIISGR